MSDNMKIWEASCKPDPKALKKIGGGRLKGMTDINPIWRIKKLTELFGPVGIGWYTDTIRKDVHEGANGEIVATVDINLYVTFGDVWSQPIFGTGGSMLVAKEKAGLHTSDEAFKMAETDALGVACKKLGFAADIYWEKGRSDSKYSAGDQVKSTGSTSNAPVSNDLSPDVAIGLVNQIVKLGNECTSLKDLGDLWNDNKDAIARLPKGLLADLTSYKDERKEELK